MSSRDTCGGPAPLPWRWIVGVTTAAGLLSGVRMLLTYRASGVRLTPFEAFSSGLMDWWVWILLAPLALRLADRFEPSREPSAGPSPWRVAAVHSLAAVVLSLAHLFLFSSLSGVVRHLRFGDPFRVSVFSPMLVLFVPGMVFYAILVVARWWSTIRGGSSTAAPPPPQPPPEATLTPSPPIGFQAGRGTLHLRPDEIDWVRAAGNYLELHGGHGTHLVRETLKSAQERLGSERFVRIHRSMLVRADAVVGRVDGRQPAVLLGDGTRLPIGASFRELVADGLGSGV